MELQMAVVLNCKLKACLVMIRKDNILNCQLLLFILFTLSIWQAEATCRYNEQSDSDEDLGGNDVAQSDDLRFILIDNLETDLSPTTICQFIYNHTSISPEAYVFPSRSSVPYTSGAVILDSETKLEKIFEFLINPEHIIVSKRGRYRCILHIY